MIYLSEAVSYVCSLYRDIEGNIDKKHTSEKELDKIITKIEVTVFLGNLINYENYEEPLYINTLHQDIKGELLKDTYKHTYDYNLSESNTESMINAYLDYKYADPNGLKHRIKRVLSLSDDNIDILSLEDIDFNKIHLSDIT